MREEPAPNWTEKYREYLQKGEIYSEQPNARAECPVRSRCLLGSLAPLNRWLFLIFTFHVRLYTLLGFFSLIRGFLFPKTLFFRTLDKIFAQICFLHTFSPPFFFYKLFFLNILSHSKNYVLPF